MMKKMSLIFYCLLAVVLHAHAQQNTEATIDTTQAITADDYGDDQIADEEETDGEFQNALLPQASPRHIDEKMVKAVSNSKEFGYMRYIDSALRYRKTELADNREMELPDENISFDWVKPLLYILAISGLLFLIWRLWVGKGVLFTASNKKLAAENPAEEDPLIVAGAAVLAAEAIRKKEYRLATRYLFVDMLFRLGENGKLQILSRKTNQEYLKEIQQQQSLHNDLATLMLQFEYVWYGGFTPSEKQFETIQSTFKKFETTWL